jgi:hypothetical protein
MLDREHLTANVSFIPKSASVILYFGFNLSYNYETPVETEDEQAAELCQLVKGK